MKDDMENTKISSSEQGAGRQVSGENVSPKIEKFSFENSSFPDCRRFF